MTTSSTNEATALMRDAMDKALSAPTGVRLTFPDEKHGGRGPAEKEARTWAQRMYTARADIKRAMVSAFKRDLPPDANITDQLAAVPKEIFAGPYDALYATVVRKPDDTGWWLVIMRADAKALGLEIF